MRSLFLLAALLASASLAGAADCGCASCPGACDCGCQFVLADAKAPTPRADGLIEHHVGGTCYLLTPAQLKDAGLLEALKSLPAYSPAACAGGSCGTAQPMLFPRQRLFFRGGAFGGCAGGQCGR